MRAYTAVINPISGGGTAPQKWAPIGELLKAGGAEVRAEHSRSAEHAIELATEAAQRGDVVVAVGGDGLVRDVTQGVVSSGGVLGIVPGGRGNDFAAKLGLSKEPTVLARMLSDTPERAIDVIDIGGSYVPGNVYAGLDSVANKMINDARWLPPLVVYRLAPIRAIIPWRPPTFELTLDGEKRTVKAHMIVVANSGGYGHGLKIVPGAVVDDGLLDVLIVGSGIRKSQVASFMKKAKSGAHTSSPHVEVLRAREIVIAADRELPLCFDGDQFGVLPRAMSIKPAGLRIIAP